MRVVTWPRASMYCGVLFSFGALQVHQVHQYILQKHVQTETAADTLLACDLAKSYARLQADPRMDIAHSTHGRTPGGSTSGHVRLCPPTSPPHHPSTQHHPAGPARPSHTTSSATHVWMKLPCPWRFPHRTMTTHLQKRRLHAMGTWPVTLRRRTCMAPRTHRAMR